MQDRGERHSLQKTVRRKEEPQGGGASPGIKRIGKASASGKDGVDKVKGSGEFEGVHQDTIVGDEQGVVGEKDGVGRGVSRERVCACWGL